MRLRRENLHRGQARLLPDFRLGSSRLRHRRRSDLRPGLEGGHGAGGDGTAMPPPSAGRSRAGACRERAWSDSSGASGRKERRTAIADRAEKEVRGPARLPICPARQERSSSACAHPDPHCRRGGRASSPRRWDGKGDGGRRPRAEAERCGKEKRMKPCLLESL